MTVFHKPLSAQLQKPMRTAIGLGDGGLPRQGLLYFARSPLYEDWEPVDFEAYTIAEDFVWLGHKLPETLFATLGAGFWFASDGAPVTHVPSEIVADTTPGVYFSNKRGLGVFDVDSLDAAYISKIEAYFQ